MSSDSSSMRSPYGDMSPKIQTQAKKFIVISEEEANDDIEMTIEDSSYPTQLLSPTTSTTTQANTPQYELAKRSKKLLKNSKTVPVLKESKTIKKTQKGDRVKKLITRCPHTDKPHYAKGMCRACYNYKGRHSLATACPHTDRQMYAFGKCVRCYSNERHRKVTAEAKLFVQKLSF